MCSRAGSGGRRSTRRRTQAAFIRVKRHVRLPIYAIGVLCSTQKKKEKALKSVRQAWRERQLSEEREGRPQVGWSRPKGLAGGNMSEEEVIEVGSTECGRVKKIYFMDLR